MENEDLIKDIATLKQDNKALNRRMDGVEGLTRSIHTIAAEIKAMRCDVTDISERISELEQKPAKRYESALSAAISAIIGIAIGYIMG